jgi:predicted transcriptional regulator
MKSKPTLGEFRLTDRGLERVLGPLEVLVMQALWSQSPLTVRDLLDRVSERESVAYTTVMTIAHRLHQKRFLKRRRVRGAHRYWPALSREDLERLLVTNIISGLLEDFPETTRRDATARLRHAV